MMDAGLILPIKGSDLIPGGKYEPPRVGQPGGLLTPSVPILVYEYGTTGTLELLQTLIKTEVDAVNFKNLYYFTPLTAGQISGYTLQIPNGWVLASHHSNINWSQNSGFATAAGCGTQGNYVQIPNPDANIKILLVEMRLVKQ